jgi:hypothetical protein
MIKRKSRKLRGGNNKCKDFCEKDYTPYMINLSKKIAKKYNTKHKTTKTDIKHMNKVCKKVHCNPSCSGFINPITDVTDGFKNTISENKRKKLLKKGVISGCVDITDYKL